MASSSGLLNLDNLITGNDNDDNILQISQTVESQSEREMESGGSDSSYGKFAKKMAEDMDKIITEEQANKEEKDKRISLARNQKAKEQEERQKAFGKSSKKFAGKKSFFSKSLDCESIRKTRETKTTKSTVKDAESVDQKNGVSAKPKKQNRTKKKPLANEVKTSEEVKKASKLRNITVQDFDIDSTPSSSSEEVDIVSYNKVIDNYQRSFKVKSLNRVANEGDSGSSEDSDDENSQPIKLKFHHSAEKSAAAQRRKRSNYLKKRNSNFRPNKSEPQTEVTDRSNPNQDQIPGNEPILRNKPSNPSKDKKTKQEPTNETNNPVVKVETKRTLKIILPSRKTNQQKSTESKPHSSAKSDKHNYKNKDINTHLKDKKEPEKDPLTTAKDKPTTQKNKKDHRTYKNEDPKIIKNEPLKYSSSDDSANKGDRGQPGDWLKFERSPRSSENEIDWKAVEEMKVKKSVVPSHLDKEESEDELDLNTIIQNRKQVKTPVDSNVKINIERNDSSSDLDAQFDACLVKFNKLK